MMMGVFDAGDDVVDAYDYSGGGGDVGGSGVNYRGDDAALVTSTIKRQL